ncbi:FtsH protease activity modulator HflK [Halalkalibacterium halodurans]|jgi:membrane protease subunit HflK|uniref:Protein HflK n=2 Tax=Halalkalibacterium halodurans TaxID=86665 RepID=Q9K852_HALH5|nr:FtsH protease activity modulator HflK [Halalkalibacterium halodurans]MDY7223688.1 FtsH protease activity modulator HflK [Halalkalibacterium halodurans]MDY7242909.1 FtsH protease activity modulator HflK [Halalkalibacterium halodurans]MED3645644.1 FtsH protease activity modulator HflK [Halalkalibacterium halodurans]MED4082137.1 FtsH protease activity modulator HflK [Halalkalibacterium halodurans]MED4084285.1 FtsH protease activity modulator HflK [Halalkalibacterium halodurans]
MTIRQLVVGFFSLIGAAILGLFLVTGWYIVDETEQAALITFGKVEETIDEPGLKFKMPWPIQKVEILPRGTFNLQVGYKEDEGEVVEFTDEAKMITGDENIVFADLAVQWRITDPEQYLYSTEDPKELLYNATSSALRSVIGSASVDEALTDERPTIEADIFESLVELMDLYQIGISISDVKLQDVELPTEEVRRAFTDVTDAREERLTKINEANRYRNQETNEVEGEKDAIISRAEGQRADRIETARGDVARFNALYEEYLVNPDVTRQRLVLETLESILPDTEIYIMDSNNDTINYLPIRPLERQQQAPVEEGTNNE